MQAKEVFNLAAHLAQIADEHPRHVAIDALDIASVLLRSGRDYTQEKEVNLAVPLQSTLREQESPAVV
jgi:hypothetical protein